MTYYFIYVFIFTFIPYPIIFLVTYTLFDGLICVCVCVLFTTVYVGSKGVLNTCGPSPNLSFLSYILLGSPVPSAFTSSLHGLSHESTILLLKKCSHPFLLTFFFLSILSSPVVLEFPCDFRELYYGLLGSCMLLSCLHSSSFLTV